MRKKIIAGNWKMFHGPKDAEKFLSEFLPQVKPSATLEWVIFPPYVTLPLVQSKLKGSFVKFGGQNVHEKLNGAFTGEISSPMLAELGCSYTLIGHSERRQYFAETNQSCAQKIKVLGEHGIIPMYCVGESQKERDENKTSEVLVKQIVDGLSLWNKDMPLVIAYEPVWAIGTGKVATPLMAEEAHQIIRKTLAELYGSARAGELCILYGGSVKPENSMELAMQANIDGFLVGGASLNAKSFAQIGQIPL